MCGINGIFQLKKSLSGDQVNGKLIAMNDSIIHRGPDSGGVHVNGNVGLGFRRLSIIDLSNSANQPMQSDDNSLVIVFNGEIYNYIEIYNELLSKGHVFKTRSDTEVILNAYKEWGKACIQKFNGMWAFAIYDSRKDELFASRDRLGVKPFYYHLNENYIVFSSETKAIVKVENLREANRAKAFEYLAYGYNKSGDGETFYKAVNELLPGQNLTIKNSKVSFDTYWELKPNMQKVNSQEEAYAKFSELLEDAIRLRYRSDVPIALLLSGGLDSSAIALITEKLKSKGLLDQNVIEAFTVHFPGFVDDELDITKAFADTCSHIHLNVLTPDISMIMSGLNEIVYDLDQPVGSFSHVIHNQMMKQVHAKGIKVALNGQGSDEAFYGYDKHVFGYFLLDRLFEGSKDFIKQIRSIRSYLGFSYSMIFSQMVKAFLAKRTASYLRAKYSEKTIDCLDKKFVDQNYNHYKYDYQFSTKGSNLMKYAIQQISNTGLNSILHYEDVSSMNASIEMRSPFMDYRLMEFAFSIPDDMKFDMGITKKIIRETVGKDLPENIVANSKKIGFSSPFSDYLKSPGLKSLVNEILSSESFKNKKIWNQALINERFRDPDKYPEFPFWRFLNYEIWTKVNNVTGL